MADRNRRKTKVGIVVSDKMDKTVVVAIEDLIICVSLAIGIIRI